MFSQPFITSCHSLFLVLTSATVTNFKKQKKIALSSSVLHMDYTSISTSLLFFFLAGAFNLCTVLARPATFLQDFQITWSDNHIKQLEGGRAIQLILDQSSGCGFASRKQYLFGHVSMKIKLIPGDSAGTVAAFYVHICSTDF